MENKTKIGSLTHSNKEQSQLEECTRLLLDTMNSKVDEKVSAYKAEVTSQLLGKISDFLEHWDE